MTDTQLFTQKIIVTKAGLAVDLLAEHSGLSKSRVKDCMLKGGVWLGRQGRRKAVRLRRATTMVQAQQTLEINYDQQILALIPGQPILIEHRPWYSLWHKPAGLLAQGTRFGDHCALPRVAQKILKLRQELYAVHRLDREAKGLVLLAHSSRAAGLLSSLFAKAAVLRQYQLVTRGQPPWDKYTMDLPLNGQAAVSQFQVIKTNLQTQTTLMQGQILTGRKHQIRRHLALLGYPIVGDYRYGCESRSGVELQLWAQSLGFFCPWTKKQQLWVLPDSCL